MKYFNKEDEIIKFNNSFPFNNNGSHAKIYRLGDDACLKKFRYAWDVYDLKMFKEYMKMELNNYYKIYDLLYNKYGRLSGYTMKHYDNKIDNVIDMPSEYITDNFNNISKDISTLSNNGIIVKDLIPSNLIYGDNKITVIDIDQYKLDKDMDKDTLNRVNEINLCVCLYRLLKSNLLNGYVDDNLAKYLNNLDSLFDEKKINVMTKKLSKYKYPIDYFSK